MIQQRLGKEDYIWQETETWHNFADQETLLLEDIKVDILENEIKIVLVIVFRRIEPDEQLTLGGTVFFDFKERCVKWGTAKDFSFAYCPGFNKRKVAAKGSFATTYCLVSNETTSKDCDTSFISLCMQNA